MMENSNNYSAGEKGTIFARKRAQITLMDNEFIGNTAEGSGGVLYLDGSTIYATNNRFEQNSAVSGGMYCSLIIRWLIVDL
jgi:predicted outer membrane repeat protein